jgi:dTDP-4-dehydrorhamnose 3,5-epimerase
MMRFLETEIAGVVIVEVEPHVDERGSFARLCCPHEFAAAGIDFRPRQTSLSRNLAVHTLRGMHFQDPPHAEGKLVRVTRGRIHDVAVDLRPDSPTFRRWVAVALDAGEMRGLYIAPGCAHGFLTLEADTDVLYQIDRDHVPGAGRGVRWNDPAFAINWPIPPAVISKRDATWPDFAMQTQMRTAASG